MGICQSGVDVKTRGQKVFIDIAEIHPLVCLSQSLPWRELVDLVLPDLQKTKSGRWWLGRKLQVRIHLGVYLLQQLFNKTDRQIEYDVKDNAAYQIFCGLGIVEKWHVPDHTKVEEFRSRLNSETHQKLANYMAAHSVKLGFGDPTDIDIDSTVQEANMAYPADSSLLKKLGGMAHKVAKFLNEILQENIVNPITVNLKKINSAARSYFFLPKNSSKETRNEELAALLEVVQSEITPIINACENIFEKNIDKSKWNVKRTILQIKNYARQYLLDVKSFIENRVMVPTKCLSFHLKDIMCCTKGKPGKKYQFGRIFQLARITGNFLFVGKCGSIAMPDKSSVEQMIQEHANTFGSIEINSVATDKGYYSHKNEKFLKEKKVAEIGIQRPKNIKKNPPQPITSECEEKLHNRRSGIEPLIGHAKHGGQLGRSRMKSDKTIEASGYTSVTGLNLRQLIRHQKLAREKKIA